MTYISNEDVERTIAHIIGDVFSQFRNDLTDEDREYIGDRMKSMIGQFMGIRTEDGEERLYDVTLVEGEPYVYDA